MRKIKSEYFSQILAKTNLEDIKGLHFVGGCVRDFFMNGEGFEPKDIDLCVEGIEIDELISILNNKGSVNIVGKSFGVIVFKPHSFNELVLEISVPRIDNKGNGDRHKDIVVEFNSQITITEDLKRRDITINSIALKHEEGVFQIIDPFNGIDAIKRKKIEATSKSAFTEDPLRILRSIQFASRFGFDIEKETFSMMIENSHKLKFISKERIFNEFKKGFEKTKDLTRFEKLIRTFINTSLEELDIKLKPFSSSKKETKSFGQFLFRLFDCKNFKEAFSLSNKIADLIDVLSLLEKRFKSKEELVEVIFSNRKKTSSCLGELLEECELELNVKKLLIKIESKEIPFNPEELKVTSKELIASGLKGPQIKKAQEDLLKLIALNSFK